MTGLWRSTPLKPPPLRPLLTGIAALWAGPMVAGWVLAGGVRLLTGLLSPEAQLAAYRLVIAMIFSPIYAWIGWIAALPAIWFLLRDGWFGWASAALTGLAAGIIAAGFLGTAIAPPLGVAALLALRALLGSWLPLSPGGTSLASADRP